MRHVRAFGDLINPISSSRDNLAEDLKTRAAAVRMLYLTCMYAYCRSVARTKCKLERTTKCTWTNTFTKHSKCYKMGCIGPVGFFPPPIWIFVQTKVARHHCTTDSSRERLAGPENLRQTPSHFHGAAVKSKKKKRSFLLQVSSVQYQTSQKGCYRRKVVCENMSQYFDMPGYTCDM